MTISFRTTGQHMLDVIVEETEVFLQKSMCLLSQKREKLRSQASFIAGQRKTVFLL